MQLCYRAFWIRDLPGGTAQVVTREKLRVQRSQVTTSSVDGNCAASPYCVMLRKAIKAGSGNGKNGGLHQRRQPQAGMPQQGDAYTQQPLTPHHTSLFASKPLPRHPYRTKLSLTGFGSRLASSLFSPLKTFTHFGPSITQSIFQSRTAIGLCCLLQTGAPQMASASF